MDPRKPFTTVPNQKIVTILPYEEPPSKSEPYGKITRRAERAAARLLNDKTAAHILYYYLALNQNGYVFALSPRAIYNELGVSERQYHKAIERLIHTGFLVQNESGSNLWNFIRIPRGYKDASVEDEPVNKTPATSREVSSPKGTDSLLPEDQTVSPQRDRPSSPMEIDRIPSEEGRNIIDITSDNINNITDKQIDSPTTEEQTVINSLIGTYLEKFGYLDRFISELVSLHSIVERKYKITSNHRSYPEKYIFELERLGSKYEKARESRRSHEEIEYQCHIESGHDKISGFKWMALALIRRVVSKEYPFLPTKRGVWVKGWNQSTQEPNVLWSVGYLPEDLLEQQQDDIDDIPKEYYHKPKDQQEEQ